MSCRVLHFGHDRKREDDPLHGETEEPAAGLVQRVRQDGDRRPERPFPPALLREFFIRRRHGGDRDGKYLGDL